MKKYVELAKKLAVFPGTEKWPWVLAETSSKSRPIHVFPKDPEFERPEALGPWLRVDELNPWSSTIWLRRAGLCTCKNGDLGFVTDLGITLAVDGWWLVADELDYMKVIYAIGAGAFLGTHPDISPLYLEIWNKGNKV